MYNFQSVNTLSLILVVNNRNQLSLKGFQLQFSRIFHRGKNGSSANFIISELSD